MGLFDNAPPGSFPPGGSGLRITRTFVDGHTLRLTPELEEECRRIYWAERTWGMTDEQVMSYLSEGNAERGKAHLIDPYPNSNMETLH
jgi:hypothetical protein